MDVTENSLHWRTVWQAPPPPTTRPALLTLLYRYISSLVQYEIMNLFILNEIEQIFQRILTTLDLSIGL